MRCSKAHKIVSPYIDGELSEWDIRTLEDHMKGCNKCWAEFEESRELHSLFARTDKFEAPYGFHTRVMANISSGKTKEIPRIPVFARLAEGFVIIGIIALGIFSGNLLLKGYTPDKAREVISSLSLDVFDSVPPGTLSGAYLAMTEVRDEK